MAKNYYKYGITSQELKEVRKYIIQDIKDGNAEYPYKNPRTFIENMTLRIYFDMIKECMVALADENGIVKDRFGNTWCSEFKNSDIRKQDPIEVAKSWMDGRGLFTEHFNSQLYKNEKHWGNWDNIDSNSENRWYYEDRLDDPKWFKECITVIGHGGHPTEMLTCGNFNPIPIDDNYTKWVLSFGIFSRCDYYILKAYLHFKKFTLIPCFVDNAKMYLTDKQQEQLKFEGYII